MSIQKKFFAIFCRFSVFFTRLTAFATHFQHKFGETPRSGGCSTGGAVYVSTGCCAGGEA